jgi:hypothetical protein
MYDIDYKPRTAIKVQALSDFVAEWIVEAHALHRVAMALRTSHTCGIPYLDKLSKVLIRVVKNLKCTSLAHEAYSLGH